MNTKRDRGILIFWVISWVLLSNLFILYRFGGINWAQEIFVMTSREWGVLIGQTTFIGLAGGLFFGMLDIYLSRKNYLHRINFGVIVLLKSAGYCMIAITVLFLGFYLAARVNGLSSQEALNRTFHLYASSYFIVIMVYLLVNTLLLNFIRQVSKKFGPGNLIHIFFGSYYQPVEEDRIFIFLDLKSSTLYAERLGHIKYSQLIQDCFYDITPVVDNYKAEIYQYVGDEVVLSWKAVNQMGYQYAILLFFAFKDKIRERSDHYLKKYGFLPEFKAGINAGRVTVAEVGVIKKEIAYHGDVLNTASRIQEQCNMHNRLLLCSEYFINKLSSYNHFKVELVNEVLLKGKQVPVRIYGVELSKREETAC